MPSLPLVDRKPRTINPLVFKRSIKFMMALACISVCAAHPFIGTTLMHLHPLWMWLERTFVMFRMRHPPHACLSFACDVCVDYMCRLSNFCQGVSWVPLGPLRGKRSFFGQTTDNCSRTACMRACMRAIDVNVYQCSVINRLHYKDIYVPLGKSFKRVIKTTTIKRSASGRLRVTGTRALKATQHLT